MVRTPVIHLASAFALIVALTFVVAEIAARIIFPLPEILNFSRARYTPMAASTEIQERPDLAHAAYTYESAPDGARFVHHLNLYGFRDRDWSRARTRDRRVLFVGDSFTEGFGASDDETIPRVFEDAARKSNVDLEAWNLGIGAAGWPEYLGVVQEAVPAFHPDEVVVVLYANDMLALLPLDPAKAVANFEPQLRSVWESRLVTAVARVIERRPLPLVGHRTPFPFFAPVPDITNPWTTNDAQLSTMVQPAIADAMRAGRFNPFVVDETQSFARYLPDPVEVGGYMSFLKGFLDRRGIALRLAYIPYANQVSDYYRTFSQQYCSGAAPSLVGFEYQLHASIIAGEAVRLGIPFLDLTPLLQGNESQGKHMYWDYDEHMRAAGYAAVARAIFEWDSKTRSSAGAHEPVSQGDGPALR
jgi:lysophospholipase L1-like esterase